MQKRKYSFKKINRLKSKKGFQLTFTRGRAVVDGLAVLYVRYVGDDVLGDSGDLKIGFAAGKKLGCAVVRNRIKRLMREVFRKHQDKLREGYHIVWMARKKLARADYMTYERVFLRLAKRAGVLEEQVGL